MKGILAVAALLAAFAAHAQEKAIVKSKSSVPASSESMAPASLTAFMQVLGSMRTTDRGMPGLATNGSIADPSGKKATGMWHQ